MVADVNEKIMSGLIKMLFRLADTSVFLFAVAFSQTHLISDHHKFINIYEVFLEFHSFSAHE